MKGVEHIKELLHDGEAIQVVLSSQASAEFHGDAFTLYRRMRSINPSRTCFSCGCRRSRCSVPPRS